MGDPPQVSVSERQTWDVDPDLASGSPPQPVSFLAKKAVAGGWGKEGSGAWEQDARSLKIVD